ncbi:hypothetical protein JIR001_28680 [Polycladomyces abyssicola]|uniref:Uncharacterized protein n=1 Tax=Polycladomyces abyssicola TaxID=1125966 RepID=A0A8D5ZNU2_9BACL|nr:hypothetical protein [Polycladomyces abyssicola]BCU83085.1 hypothetical protein JIR001_28680 [Polycladomyces abyssicola]
MAFVKNWWEYVLERLRNWLFQEYTRWGTEANHLPRKAKQPQE